MNDIYSEIELLTANMTNLPYDEIISILSDAFMGLRSSNRKRHFGENTNIDIRHRAIITAACCVALVQNLDDAVKEPGCFASGGIINTDEIAICSQQAENCTITSVNTDDGSDSGFHKED